MKRLIFLMVIFPLIAGCLSMAPFIQGMAEEGVRQRHYQQGIPYYYEQPPIQTTYIQPQPTLIPQPKIAYCSTDMRCYVDCTKNSGNGYCRHICKTCD